MIRLQHSLFICLLSFTPLLCAAQTRTIRIVTYNIEADIDGYTAARPGLVAPPSGTTQQGGVLEGIGEEPQGPDPAQPVDIFALQETTSNTTTVAPVADALNTYYNSPGMYVASTYQATESGGFAGSGNGPNAVVYNTTTLQLVASVPVDPPGGTGALGSSSGEYREVMRYQFAPAGVTPTSANTFYVYVSHYKSGTGSSNITARSGEAQIIRNDEANHLPPDARVVYVGDYNVTTSGEAGYQTILSATAPNGIAQGQAIDPMNISGSPNVNWGTQTSNTNILAMESESSTDLRYRDDLQLMTTNVFYGAPGGLALVAGTYHVFGNNGTTAYFGTVNSGANTALNDLAPGSPISASTLKTDLVNASDHLPVVADYTIPLGVPPVAGFAANPTNGSAPLIVTFTNLSSGATSYTWDFGDGNISTAANPTNTYTNAGLYTITLTAVGLGGTNTTVTQNLIFASNSAPPVLQLAQPSLSVNGFQFVVSNQDGYPITADEQSRIGVWAASDLTTDPAQWTLITDGIFLTNGCLQVVDTNTFLYPQRFYRILESP